MANQFSTRLPVGAAAGCDLLMFFFQDQKIAACGSSYRDLAKTKKEWAVLATALVLVAALLHAAWNTLIKFSAERLLVVACMDSVALLFVALMVPFLSLPPLEIWPWI